jgi:hypothetical protein
MTWPARSKEHRTSPLKVDGRERGKLPVWDIKLLFASQPLAFAVSVHAEPEPVTVHADRVIGEIRPIWNYFGYDEAGTTLTREGRDLLGKLDALSGEPIRIRVHHHQRRRHAGAEMVEHQCLHRGCRGQSSLRLVAARRHHG